MEGCAKKTNLAVFLALAAMVALALACVTPANAQAMVANNDYKATISGDGLSVPWEPYITLDDGTRAYCYQPHAAYIDGQAYASSTDYVGNGISQEAMTRIALFEHYCNNVNATSMSWTYYERYFAVQAKVWQLLGNGTNVYARQTTWLATEAEDAAYVSAQQSVWSGYLSWVTSHYDWSWGSGTVWRSGGYQGLVTALVPSLDTRALGLDVNPDYNEHGADYGAGARVSSYSVKRTLADGSSASSGTVTDFWGGCCGLYAYKGTTWQVSSVTYRTGYHYASATLRTDGDRGATNVAGAGLSADASGTSFTFSHSQPQDLYLSINTDPNSYKVRFAKNAPATTSRSVTGTMSDQVMTYDVAVNLTKNAFALTGYTFTGWNTSADGTGTAYSDEQEVVNLTAENGGVVTLYAQWSANPYGLTLKGLLDGTASYDLGSYGTCTVSIAGVAVMRGKGPFSQEVACDTAYAVSAIAATTGHVYRGLGAGSAALAGKIPAYDSEVILKFETKRMTVVFHRNDGTSATYTQTFTWGSGEKAFGLSGGSPAFGTSGQFGDWKFSGYTLDGWSEDPDATTATYAVNEPVSDEWVDADYDKVIDVYAVCHSRASFVVDGSALGYGVDVPYGGTYDPYSDDELTRLATKANCSGLDGWYTDAACTSPYDAKSAFGASKTLYARNKVAVSFALSKQAEDLLAGREYFTERELTEVAEPQPGSDLPGTWHGYYGDTLTIGGPANKVVFARCKDVPGASGASSPLEIVRAYSWNGKCYLSYKATSSSKTVGPTLTVTRSRTLYLKWDASGVDGYDSW